MYFCAFSIFPQASCGRHSSRSGPRHAYTPGELPPSESPFSSWKVYAHPAGEQCKRYSRQRFKQPGVTEKQNNVTDSEDVSKDSLQVVTFVFWWLLKATIRWDSFYTRRGRRWRDTCVLAQSQSKYWFDLLIWTSRITAQRCNEFMYKAMKSRFFSPKNVCTFSSFCCPQYWGEQTRVLNWTSCVWFDITNEAWWGRWTFSWAPSRLQKAPLTATGKHYAKEGKINTVRLGWGWGRVGGGGGGREGEDCPWTTIACSVGVNFLSLNKAAMKFPRLITPYLPTGSGIFPSQCC